MHHTDDWELDMSQEQISSMGFPPVPHQPGDDSQSTSQKRAINKPEEVAYIKVDDKQNGVGHGKYQEKIKNLVENRVLRSGIHERSYKEYVENKGQPYARIEKMQH